MMKESNIRPHFTSRSAPKVRRDVGQTEHHDMNLFHISAKHEEMIEANQVPENIGTNAPNS